MNAKTVMAKTFPNNNTKVCTQLKLFFIDTVNVGGVWRDSTETWWDTHKIDQITNKSITAGQLEVLIAEAKEEYIKSLV